MQTLFVLSLQCHTGIVTGTPLNPALLQLSTEEAALLISFKWEKTADGREAESEARGRLLSQLSSSLHKGEEGRWMREWRRTMEGRRKEERSNGIGGSRVKRGEDGRVGGESKD